MCGDPDTCADIESNDLVYSIIAHPCDDADMWGVSNERTPCAKTLMCADPNQTTASRTYKWKYAEHTEVEVHAKHFCGDRYTSSSFRFPHDSRY